MSLALELSMAGNQQPALDPTNLTSLRHPRSQLHSLVELHFRLAQWCCLHVHKQIYILRIYQAS